ncbi:MAG: hemerythrin domain-containing protein [Gammaproteobacteria bacterium]
MTRAKTKSRSTKSDKAEKSPKDAIALLKADHKAVKQMFDEYAEQCEAEAEASERQPLAERICAELTVHTQIEEELFYPALRDALDEQALLDEAEVEHTTAKDLIEQIRAMSADDDLYDAKVTVLGEYVLHHVKEEEQEMFKQARDIELDLAELGQAMAARRDELRAEFEDGAEDEDEDGAAELPLGEEDDDASRPRRSARG